MISVDEYCEDIEIKDVSNVITIKEIGIETDGVWKGTYKQIPKPLTQT